VFCNDATKFNEGITNFETASDCSSLERNVLVNGIYTGECSESGRDQDHAQISISHLAESAQIAYNQGIDLFAYQNNLVLSAFEYCASYNLGNTVPFTSFATCNHTYTSISSVDRCNTNPTRWLQMYELVYNHYKSVGISAPYTQQVADMNRPEKIDVNKTQCGFGTLAYSQSAPITIIEDDFATAASTFHLRAPAPTTVNSRTYSVSYAGDTNSATVSGGQAILENQVAELIGINNGTTYVRPNVFTISLTFDEGTLGQDSPARSPRGVFAGFWETISSNPAAFAKMRGVFINPNNGTLALWNGSSTSTDAAVQTLPYQGTWSGGTTTHTLTYSIDNVTGNLYNCVLDGKVYIWNATNIFSVANSQYAGFGVSGTGAGQVGHIDQFKLITRH
jgi:hypothetical protein